ncbi:hypothetical protein GCM10010218_09990 [Streptomyces mashuensis]|uniref:Uncharacterized protein n=1 Tax=Streptomyces mashuensis TaxID=33904 RepID=A0A919EAP2_9ACTN|nr:hypothetical protein GCM10010218_09990 [Streptomyces mashuensis]
MALASPGGAHAAAGTFVYHTQAGAVPHELADPVDGRCYPVGDAHGVVGNETDRGAYLYDTPDCRGPAAYVPTGFYAVGRFHSVNFVP